MGRSPAYEVAARELGHTIASRGMGLVYGGTSIGLMGAMADAALAAGGRVVGVLPRALRSVEIAHPGLTKLHLVETMHERKALMADLSDGFIAMPGGAGTLDELFEIITWAQLSIHEKPVALLNVDGYWDKLIELIEHIVAQGFIEPRHRPLFRSAPDADAVIEVLTSA